MTRKAALRQIGRVIVTYLSVEGFKKSPLNLAQINALSNEILGNLEANGVRPPSYKYWNAPRPYNYVHGDSRPPLGLEFSMLNGEELSEWEPENEEK